MATTRLLINDRYEVEMGSPIGEGGMALVYRGVDVRTKREVACKTLRAEYRDNAAHRARFRQEAELIASIPHRNLVSIYDFVDDTSGTWAVMELVQGPTLRQLLADQGAQSPRQVAGMLDQLADVFDVIHGKHLVHLDMKPQNVMIHRDGVVKLIDFGLAQAAGQVQRRTDGKTFGTVAYIAPEQANGQPVHQETDVYAIGCVMYELLTGRQPFVAEGGDDAEAQMLEMHRSRRPVAPSEVEGSHLPTWVDTAVGWALEKDPGLRYRSVSSFAASFRVGLEGRPLGVSARSVPAGSAAASGFAEEEADRSDAVVTEMRPSQPSRLGRIYRAGALRARRSRKLRRRAWQLVVMLAMTLLLFVTLSTLAGSPPGFFDRFRENQQHWDTLVQVDSLLVRDAPGKGAYPFFLLNHDDPVTVIGESERVDGLSWVPVTCACGDRSQGWLWEDGVVPPEWTGVMGWMNGVDSARDAVTGTIGDAGDRIGDLWP